jgi:hypothetical protein
MFIPYIRAHVIRLDELMLVLQKSVYTKDMELADALREEVFRGFYEAVKAYCKNVNEAKRRAAVHLFNLLKGYHKAITRGNYIEASAAFHNLLQDLRGVYASDVATLVFGEWVTAIDEAEQKFLGFSGEREQETIEKPREAIRAERALLDAAYRCCVIMMEMLLIIDGLGGDISVDPESLDTGSHEDGDPTPPYLRGNINYNFVWQWNVEATYYHNLLAHRDGRRAKANEEEDDDELGEE